jgi:hypothetical protein
MRETRERQQPAAAGMAETLVCVSECERECSDAGNETHREERTNEEKRKKVKRKEAVFLLMHE